MESRVVITHAIGFDSAGMWLIFPCLYHHSISVGAWQYWRPTQMVNTAILFPPWTPFKFQTSFDKKLCCRPSLRNGIAAASESFHLYPNSQISPVGAPHQAHCTCSVLPPVLLHKHIHTLLETTPVEEHLLTAQHTLFSREQEIIAQVHIQMLIFRGKKSTSLSPQ